MRFLYFRYFCLSFLTSFNISDFIYFDMFSCIIWFLVLRKIFLIPYFAKNVGPSFDKVHRFVRWALDFALGETCCAKLSFGFAMALRFFAPNELCRLLRSCRRLNFDHIIWLILDVNWEIDAKKAWIFLQKKAQKRMKKGTFTRSNTNLYIVGSPFLYEMDNGFRFFYNFYYLLYSLFPNTYRIFYGESFQINIAFFQKFGKLLSVPIN